MFYRQYLFEHRSEEVEQIQGLYLNRMHRPEPAQLLHRELVLRHPAPKARTRIFTQNKQKHSKFSLAL